MSPSDSIPAPFSYTDLCVSELWEASKRFSSGDEGGLTYNDCTICNLPQKMQARAYVASISSGGRVLMKIRGLRNWATCSSQRHLNMSNSSLSSTFMTIHTHVHTTFYVILLCQEWWETAIFVSSPLQSTRSFQGCWGWVLWWYCFTHVDVSDSKTSFHSSWGKNGTDESACVTNFPVFLFQWYPDPLAKWLLEAKSLFSSASHFHFLSFYLNVT